MTGPGMILAGQVSALGAAGLVAVAAAVWPSRSALTSLLRGAARRARQLCDRIAAALTTRHPAPRPATIHGRHRLVDIPAQRHGGR